MADGGLKTSWIQYRATESYYLGESCTSSKPKQQHCFVASLSSRNRLAFCTPSDAHRWHRSAGYTNSSCILYPVTWSQHVMVFDIIRHFNGIFALMFQAQDDIGYLCKQAVIKKNIFKNCIESTWRNILLHAPNKIRNQILEFHNRIHRTQFNKDMQLCKFWRKNNVKPTKINKKATMLHPKHLV